MRRPGAASPDKVRGEEQVPGDEGSGSPTSVAAQCPPTPVLLLSLSKGLGGGIERYLETVEWALAVHGVEFHRIDLTGRGAWAHARMIRQARAHLAAEAAPARLIAAHPALLPTVLLLARRARVAGISVICHGSDVWNARHRIRRRVETRLMRKPGVRVVAVSSFTAGVLAPHRMAVILPPGLSQGWFDTLVEESAVRDRSHPGTTIVTAFRLADWRDKGLPELLDAVAILSRPEIRVRVCGSGVAPPELRKIVQDHKFCTLRSGISDRELAHEFATADLAVLATRTRSGRQPSGEGFGLVLLEAQVAGTPVVAPAHGGSHDAFVDQLTGITPTDETAGALAEALGELLDDPDRLARMAEQASAWAQHVFAPARYASRVVACLL
jgi:phosphatidylinositol alpha-1,6-mannosyltransferase